MTKVGLGGVVISSIVYTARFKKDWKKLPTDLQDMAKDKLRDLMKNPMPAGLRFEKLKGYRNPSIYTIHVTGNYKISLEIVRDQAVLRRIACHDDIDRAP